MALKAYELQELSPPTHLGRTAEALKILSVPATATTTAASQHLLLLLLLLLLLCCPGGEGPASDPTGCRTDSSYSLEQGRYWVSYSLAVRQVLGKLQPGSKAGIG